MVSPTNSQSRRRWTDAAIEAELQAQSAALGHFPTRSELVARGRRGLWDAMRTNGGVDVWRERLANGNAGPSRTTIAARAYELYEQGAPGGAEAHWLTAERELGG